MKTYIGIWILFFSLTSINCQKNYTLTANGVDYPFSEVCELPDIIEESSGLETASSGTFWSFNDSGGEPDLYQFDTSGDLLETLTLKNVLNVDWEDMTQDEAGNLYVGDFGNNDNDREDLVIYRINKSDLSENKFSIEPSKIEFSLSDQLDFPPLDTDRFFDIEAMFAKGDYLYLLTRDRSKPFIGKTTLYRLLNLPGNYVAEFMGDFTTDTEKDKGQITAADLSPDGKTLVMLAKEQIWLFQDISGEDFFRGNLIRMDLPVNVGMEGIVFQDNCSLYMTNEETKKKPGKLYTMELCP